MRKYPTSFLSRRDKACIEYGRQLEELDYVRITTYPPFSDCDLEMRRAALNAAREARERIFRHCCNCRFATSLSTAGWKCSKIHERHYGDEACLCKHYEEIRENDNEKFGITIN